MIEFEQSGVNLKIKFSNEVFAAKLPPRIFLKFKTLIADYITLLLAYDPAFTEYYEAELYNILKHKLEPSPEFIQKVKEFIIRWYAEEGVKISFKFTSKDIGTLTQEDIDQLFITSLILKILAPIIYTNILTASQSKTVLRDILSDLHKTNLDSFIFKFIQLKFLRKSGSAFWGALTSLKFQSISFHIMNLYYIIVGKMIALLDIKHNPIAFLKMMVEHIINWLITNVYTQEITFNDNELRKVKYIKDYSLIHSFAVKQTLIQLEDVVRKNFNIDPKLLRGYDYSATYKYITLPLLTKIFNTRYIYFYTYKNWGVCSFYTALLLKKFAPSLSLLQNMCTSFQEHTKRPIIKGLNVLDELYDYPSPYQKIFKQKQIFDFTVKELLSFTYTETIRRTPLTVTPTKLIPEYISFYKNLILSDQFDLLYATVRSSNLMDVYFDANMFTPYIEKILAQS